MLKSFVTCAVLGGSAALACAQNGVTTYGVIDAGVVGQGGCGNTCATQVVMSLAVVSQISSGSEHLEAHEESDDMYASIDRVVDKLERQIGSHKGVSQDRKRRGDTLRSSPDNGARSAADQEAAAALEAKAGE